MIGKRKTTLEILVKNGLQLPWELDTFCTEIQLQFILLCAGHLLSPDINSKNSTKAWHSSSSQDFPSVKERERRETGCSGAGDCLIGTRSRLAGLTGVLKVGEPLGRFLVVVSGVSTLVAIVRSTPTPTIT